METKKYLFIVLILSLFSGCATQPITYNYSPTSTISVKGKMNVGTFRYLPGETEKIKPNQIRNTALGSAIFEKNINEYIETALFLESRFVGIELNDAAKTVYGEINEFLIDDLGFSVDWTLDISYTIDGCYNERHVLQKKTDKFGDIFGTLNEVIKLNIEKLLSDKLFQNCISSSVSGSSVSSNVVPNTTQAKPIAVSETAVATEQVVSKEREVSTKYPNLVKDLNSDSPVVMQRAAKKIGEERLYADQGIVEASINVLEKSLDKTISKKDKYLVDGISWCALNLGNSGDSRATSLLGKVVASSLPKKVRSHAIHALKKLNKNN